jgi:hypothetical protein
MCSVPKVPMTSAPAGGMATGGFTPGWTCVTLFGAPPATAQCFTSRMKGALLGPWTTASLCSSTAVSCWRIAGMRSRIRAAD